MDYPTILDSFSKAIRMFTKQVIIGGCSQYIECHTAMSHKECEGWLGFAIPFLFYHWFWHLHVKSSFPPASWGLWFYVHFAAFSRSSNINLPYVIDKRATRALPWRVKSNKQTQKYTPTLCDGDPCGEAGTGVTQTQSRQIGKEGARQGQGDHVGVLTTYDWPSSVYDTHTTCSLAKRYPSVNFFSCVATQGAS